MKHISALGEILTSIVENLAKGITYKGLDFSVFGPLLSFAKYKAVFVVNDGVFIEAYRSVDDSFHSSVLFLPPQTMSGGAPGGFGSEFSSHHKRSVSLLSAPPIKQTLVVCAESVLSNNIIEDKNPCWDIDKDVEYGFFNELLVEFGYKKVDIVLEPGEFASRGAIIDVFPINRLNPVRVGFFDDCASLSEFSVDTQLTDRCIVKFRVVPIVVAVKSGLRLSDALGSSWCWFDWGVDSVALRNIKSGGEKVVCETLGFHFYEKDLFLDDKCDIIASSCLKNKGVVFDGRVFYPPWFLEHGVAVLDSVGVQLSILEADIGDYLVHEDFGVCEYRGLLSHGESEAIVLSFDGGGRVEVDSSRLYKVGFFAPKHQNIEKDSLDKGGLWKRKKNGVEKKALSVVDGLVDFYAERGLVYRAPYVGGLPLEKEFISSFVFVDTKDQSTSWGDIRGDLLGEKPMDRLLCGDVGFGKTELAIRAAFFVAMSGGRVVVLSPTTILASQLFTSFQARLSEFGISVGAITRFKSKKESDDVVLGFLDGSVNVLVGTHKLLYIEECLGSIDLLIVDEEHRFGVAQKEKVSSLKKSIDVLSMSATPIPRTLQLSVSGIRDMSLLNSPPKSRLPIKTQILYYSKDVIVRAVSNELSRGGQVFFVHNNVSSISSVVRNLSDWFPGVGIDFVHGQEYSKKIEEKMFRFLGGEIKVLVCTSIIESGIDISNANTIIISNSHLFGLSQLYQIRGRVGRATEQGYAYMLIPKDCSLSEGAFNRLKTIENNTRLGSGYAIALRDMELRGVGSLLGHSQSGGEVVGPDLYGRFIALALQRLKKGGGVRVFDPRNVSVKIYRDCYIPRSYINVDRLRLGFYKQMSSVLDENELKEYYKNIKNRFGPPPVVFRNYYHTLLIRFYAFNVFIEKVVRVDDKLLITFNLYGFDRPVSVLLEAVSVFFQNKNIFYLFRNAGDGGLVLSFDVLKDKEITTFLFEFFDKLQLVLDHNN